MSYRMYYPDQWTEWFLQDFIKAKHNWIKNWGREQLSLDAAQAGVDCVPATVVQYRCKKCNTPMVRRFGKFGDFMACPKSTMQDKHPTQSI